MEAAQLQKAAVLGAKVLSKGDQITIIIVIIITTTTVTITITINQSPTDYDNGQYKAHDWFLMAFVGFAWPTMPHI